MARTATAKAIVDNSNYQREEKFKACFKGATVLNHEGETLRKAIEKCLIEWGLDKILTITVDNACFNNTRIDFLKKKTKSRKGIILEHEFLHMRCYAHILNLIVCDGMKDIDDSIVKVHNAVRYVRSSPSRMVRFKNCIEKEAIECKNQVYLDVSTRWNSTYLMLERAL
ncbi:hypothetical protein L1049_027403 [Liquidambar formosana]|uniref:Uncharacterized protein n=1 Tax=Liquidambar formosana TaxID=63359 RepID=A0AAP0RKM9_LIQFO